MIYLDNCSTTKPDERVVEKIIESLKYDFGNPSSLHNLGLNAENAREYARREVAKLINARPEEIFFTSGGTEGNTLAIRGLLARSKGKKIITTSIEHPSVLEQLKSYKDFTLEILPVDRHGKINPKELYALVDDSTALISLFHVNNELGTINNIEEIVKGVRKLNRTVPIHVDGVQGIGKIPIDVKKLGVSAYTISSHKIHGPKGIGALYIKDGVQIDPLFIGGGQEKNLRSGTENMPGILGFGEACKILNENGEEYLNHIEELRKYFEKLVEDNFKDYYYNSPEDGAAGIINISFKNTRGEVLLHYLEQDEIYISTGSACSSNGTKKSHVLSELGIDENTMEGSIRICLSRDITRDDLDKFIEKLVEYVNEIRSIIGN